MNRKVTKHYTNGEVTVVWQNDKCIHSANCFTGLPSVFDPRVRPWVKPEGATTQQIVDQVKKCPSGALSYYMNNESENKTGAESAVITTETRVEALPDGPLMVYGKVTVKTAAGEQQVQGTSTAFCRCGHSNDKPFCDGSHRRNNFKG